MTTAPLSRIYLSCLFFKREREREARRLVTHRWWKQKAGARARASPRISRERGTLLLLLLLLLLLCLYTRAAV